MPMREGPMSITQEPLAAPSDAAAGYENPFSEALAPAEQVASIGLLPWTESLSPFADGAGTASGAAGPRSGVLYTEAMDELRDEAFDEALADLVAETAEAVGERFEGEGPGYGAEKERLGEAHLAPLGLESELYLDRLSEGLAGTDVASLSAEQFDALLDSMDTAAEGLTPAGEQFFGALLRKAKGAVKFVVNKAKQVGSAVGGAVGGLLTGVLAKLKGLIRPLLKRVLGFAIGRLPVALQPAARILASRIDFEAEAEAEAAQEGLTAAPAMATDPQALAESFDAVVAEALVDGEAAVEAGESEAFGAHDPAAGYEGPDYEGRELEALAEARTELIGGLAGAREGEDLAPVIENFVPALLAALRIGIRLVGRQRVVGFLAKYLAQLIGKWVGPQLSAPLSTAVVDAGLRLLQLESGPGEPESEAVPTLLAATVEDTVRRLAESEGYVFENEDLLQLAVAEAFEQAVATNFPARFVRPGLQQAPSLGGSFATRRARSLHPFRRYTRVPEIEVSEQLADSIRTFGGTTLGAALRAAGIRLPLRARVHVFEATVGSTLPRIAAADRVLARLGGRRAWRGLHPLTPHAAGLLLREPRLGVRVPGVYLRSRGRVAAGQRFYYLEPIGATGAPARPASAGASHPSRPQLVVDLPRGTIDVALYLADADAQGISVAIRQGNGVPALLQALSRALGSLDFSSSDRSVIIRREVEEGEDFSFAGVLHQIAPSVLGSLRRQLRGWALTAVSQWARAKGEEFARAAAPGQGVTVRLRLTGVPGLALVRDAVHGRLGAGALRKVLDGTAFSGTPATEVTAVPGRRLA